MRFSKPPRTARRSRRRLVAAAFLLAMSLAGAGWLCYRTLTPSTAPSAGPLTNVLAPAAAAPEPAPAPVAAADGAKALREAASPATQTQAGTDCTRINEAHAHATRACGGQPPACIGDQLRAVGLDPGAHDLCRMFRPGKSPLN